VDRGTGQLAVVEEIIERIGRALRVNKNHSASRRGSAQQIVDGDALLVLVNPDDVLGDVARRGADPTDIDLQMVVRQEIRRELTDVLLEGGRKHRDLFIIVLVAVAHLKKLAKLRLESHVKHLIGLVNHDELDALEGKDVSPLKEVENTARSSNQDVATSADLETLSGSISTAVENARA